MLELKNISKCYNLNGKKHNIINNINISFRRNEFVSILGKSGSGKTTLLNVIGLLDNDYSGSIYLKGRDISSYYDYLSDKLIRSKIGFVFQDYNLLDDYTVYKNMEIACFFRGIKHKKRMIINVLKKCNVFKLKDKKVNNLSGGEKQRVAIARAVIHDPDIILLDEPTGALDTYNSKVIMKFLKNVFKGKLVLMVTHDKNIAKEFSDRIVVLSDGEILYDSNPFKYIDKEKLIIRRKNIRYIDNIRYSLLNLKRKKFRNILLLIAMTISITAISFVMFLSDGFKIKVSEYQRSIFGNYPLVLTRNNSIKTIKGKATRYDSVSSIYLGNDFLVSFDNFCKENSIKYIKKYDYNFRVIGGNLKFSSFLDSNYISNNYNLLKGRIPDKDHEILLVINDDSVNGSVFDYFQISNNHVNYDKFIDKKIKIKESDKSLIVVGLVTPKSNLNFDNILESGSDFLYKKELDNIVNNKREYAIYVYSDKDKIISFLEDYKDVKYQDISESFENYLTKIISSIEKIFLVFSFISLFISLLLIVLLTYTSGIEREKEIGILKSLGARKKDIRRIFINEIVIISLIASLISILFIVLLIPFINNVLYKLTTLSNVLKFSIKIVLDIVLISVISGFIGSLIPAIKNSNKDAIKCLK